MTPEGLFYICIQFQPKLPTQYKDIYQLSVILADPRITQPKQMLWVIKGTVSMRRGFEHPKHVLENINNFKLKIVFI